MYFAFRLKRAVYVCLVILVALSSIPMNVVGTHTPNDPHWDAYDGMEEQYGPRRTANDAAWDPTNNENCTNPGSRTIVVAVLDSGIDYNH